MNTVDQVAVILSGAIIALAIIMARDALLDLGFWTIVLRFSGYVAVLVLARRAYSIFSSN